MIEESKVNSDELKQQENAASESQIQTRPTLSCSCSLVIFSYLTTNEVFRKMSKLNHKTREKVIFENRNSPILGLATLKLRAPTTIVQYDEKFLHNFA